MSDHDDHHDHGDEDGRVTSPMQEFTMSQVSTGIVILVIGVAVTFGIPLLLA